MASHLDQLYILPCISVLLLTRSTYGRVTSLLVISVLNFMANKGRGCPSWPYSRLAVAIATIMACGVAEALRKCQLSGVRRAMS